jgi:hypothetical protein
MVPRGSSLAVGHAIAMWLELQFALHRLKCIGKVRLDTVGLEVAGSLLDALDLTLDAPLLALAEATGNDVDHGNVEFGVEIAASCYVACVGAVDATVRVQVAAQLQHEIEGMARSLRQECQSLDVGQELEHGGREVRRGDGVVEVILEAVQVEVNDGDLAVELRIERDSRVGGGGIHNLSDRGGHVCGSQYQVAR